MGKRKSAGILLYKKDINGLDVLLVLHGGPYWVGKDAGAWTIPKGEFGETETPLQAAIREFQEETGTYCLAILKNCNRLYKKGANR